MHPLLKAEKAKKTAMPPEIQAFWVSDD